MARNFIKTSIPVDQVTVLNMNVTDLNRTFEHCTDILHDLLDAGKENLTDAELQLGDNAAYTAELVKSALAMCN